MPAPVHETRESVFLQKNMLAILQDQWPIQHCPDPPAPVEYEWRLGAFRNDGSFVSALPSAIIQAFHRDATWSEETYTDDWFAGGWRRRTSLTECTVIRKERDWKHDLVSQGWRLVRNWEWPGVIPADWVPERTVRAQRWTKHYDEATGRVLVSITRDTEPDQNVDSWRVELEWEPRFNCAELPIACLKTWFQENHGALQMAFLWHQLQRLYPFPLLEPWRLGIQHAVPRPDDRSWLLGDDVMVSPRPAGRRAYLFLWDAQHVLAIFPETGELKRLTGLQQARSVPEVTLLDADLCDNGRWYISDLLIEKKRHCIDWPQSQRLARLDTYAHLLPHWAERWSLRPWRPVVDQPRESLWASIWEQRQDWPFPVDGIILTSTNHQSVHWRPYYHLQVHCLCQCTQCTGRQLAHVRRMFFLRWMVVCTLAKPMYCRWNFAKEGFGRPKAKIEFP